MWARVGQTKQWQKWEGRGAGDKDVNVQTYLPRSPLSDAEQPLSMLVGILQAPTPA
jgi:hypothetical protein